MTNADIISRVRSTKGLGLIAEIARGSGVPEKTLQKIYYGDTTNPRMETLDALREWFERQPKQRRAA